MFQACIDFPVLSSQVTSVAMGGTQDSHLIKKFKEQLPQG